MREQYLSKVAGPETIISMDSTQNNNIYIDSVVDEVLAVPEIMQIGQQAFVDGFDGIGMYCFSDPGLTALRELLPIPVLGAGQVSMKLATLLGDQISVITTTSERVPQKKMAFRQMGVNDTQIASIRGLDLKNEDDESILARLTEVIQQCLDEDGAQVVVLGCLTYTKFAPKLNELFDVPIVDPGYSLVNTLELLYRQQLSQSKITYPTPVKKARQWSNGMIK